MGKKDDATTVNPDKLAAEAELGKAANLLDAAQKTIVKFENDLAVAGKRIEDLEKDVGILQADLDGSELQLGTALKRIEDLEGDIDDFKAAGPMGRPPSADELMDLLVDKASTDPIEVLRYLKKELKNRKAAPAAAEATPDPVALTARRRKRAQARRAVNSPR